MHQLLEDSSVDPDQASRTLLKVLGIEPPKVALDVWSLTDLVAFSRDTKGGCSIVESISAARENARGAREVTSTEIWECLKPPTTRLPSGNVRRNDSANTISCRMSRAGQRCSPGWPTPRCPVTTATASWCSAARSTRRHDRATAASARRGQRLVAGLGDGAAIGGCARHLSADLSGVLDAGRVVEFMLLDRLFPRSVMYSLRLAEHSLDELHNRALQPHRRHRRGAAAAGRARSELEFLPPGVLLEPWKSALPACRRPVPMSEKHWRWSTFTPPRGWRGRTPGRQWLVWYRRRRSLDVAVESRALHGYAYKSPVTASYNEARLTPRSDSRQNVILNRVEPCRPPGPTGMSTTGAPR